MKRMEFDLGLAQSRQLAFQALPKERKDQMLMDLLIDIHHGREVAVRAALESGVDPREPSHFNSMGRWPGKTVARVALTRARVDAPHVASCLRAVIEAGGLDPNETPEGQRRGMLHLALESGLPYCFSMLLSIGADPTLKGRGNSSAQGIWEEMMEDIQVDLSRQSPGQQSVFPPNFQGREDCRASWMAWRESAELKASLGVSAPAARARSL